MSILGLIHRYRAMNREDRAYYRRRFIDLKVHARSSFSQFGEDANAMEFFRAIGKRKISYIDIGANDPVIHSNTYSFYREGSAGLLVDANPDICKRLRSKRSRDTVLHRGIAAQNGPPLKLAVMDLDGLSSLDPQWSERLHEEGLARKVAEIEVPVFGINETLKEFGRTDIDFASLDVEGLDFEVVSAWDFDLFRPFLFCIETGVISKGRYVKDDAFHALMRSRGYEPLFETFANTIFLDARAWPPKDDS
ncbi:MAG: FkbM family methyltransferase [Pseudoxanthomonas sp.]